MSDFLGTTEEAEVEAVEAAEEVTGTSAEETDATESPEVEAEESAEEATEEQPTDEELADPEFQKYMKRYNVTEDILKANPSFKFLIRDKIATDKNFSELNTKLKEKPEETKASETKDQPIVNIPEYLKQTFEAADKFTDPKVFEAVVAELAQAKDVPSQLRVLQGAMHNYTLSALPKLLPDMIEKAIEAKYAGFGSQWNAWSSNAAHENAYAEMRKENPNLPESYQEVMDKALQVLPILSQPMTPKDRLSAAVKLVFGGDKAVEQVSKALETGKNLADKATKQKAAGKALGAGQTKGNIGAKTEKGDDALSEAIRKHNATLTPFGK